VLHSHAAVPAIRVVKLAKSYGAVRAVHDVTLAFEAGEIHAVVGENGAGKSTLLKMVAGVTTPDAGHVEIDGKTLAPHTAAAAIARGVGMVQQHFALIGVFTALENIVLGREPLRATARALGVLDMAHAREKVAAIGRELGVELPLDAPTETLGVGDRQRLEIARALYRDARVIILDEPTAVLTPREAEALYATLRRLADGGKAIVVVTHKLDEVKGHADVASVMRRGELVSSGAVTRDGDGRALSEAIMGGALPAELPPRTGEVGEVRLRVRDVRLERALRGVSFEVRAGEIVGIAGVEGNGQRELVGVLAGTEARDAGEVFPEAGALAVVHEDRHREGLVLDATLRDNLILGELAHFGRFGILDLPAMQRVAKDRLTRARVVPDDLDAEAKALSGGNQQKIVVERALSRTRVDTVERGARSDGGSAVLVVAHPTRGVDLGAARSIHAALLDAAARGIAVLVISSDLHELRALGHRILVMARGRIVADLAPTATDRELGDAMLGTGQA
jgi:ABC-type uncharacterized transport system ATPase subunit